MKRLFALLCIIGLQLSAVSAATYYCSPDGNGDGKAISSPTTFAAGIKKLKNPGDTLYLLSGQYNLGNTAVQNLNGTADKRIVIAGYEGTNTQGSYDAILDFRTTPYGTRGLQVKSTTTYLHIKNLTLRYSGKNNLHNEGSFNLFENLDIYGSADTGCQMKTGGNNIIKNVDSHDNFDYQTMSGSTANFGGNADGFADKQFTGAGNHYIGCRAWNNSDDGWDFFQRVSSSKTIIENCVCYQNGAPYYNLKDFARYETDKAWFDGKIGTQMTDRYGATITITLEKYPNQGNGNGFKMGGGYTNHQILIHHSIAVGNYARGFDQNNNDGAMEIDNNTAYDNNVNYGFTTKYGAVTFHNCISYLPQNGDSYKAKTVTADDHNSWSKGFSVSKSDFRSLDTTQLCAARTADGSLPDGSCLRLVSGSKLIDAGVNVGLGYNGEAPDLGCYETDGEHHDPDPEPEPEPQPEGTHAVAYVTIPNCAEDKPLLEYLRKNASLWIVETNATDPSIDYSAYEVIVLASKPSSSAAGFTPLKGINKPTVLLKPFLLKTGVWEWGTAVNTQDLSVKITNESHILFRNLTISDGVVHLFSQCETNAVTAISEWTNTTGIEILGSPISQSTYTSIAELPAGTICNGTVLPQKMVLIGLSEYSLAYLTGDGKRLVENAILYQLDMDIPSTEDLESSAFIHQQSDKYINNGQLFIRMGETVYDCTGRRIGL